jgi:hypothetical protein
MPEDACALADAIVRLADDRDGCGEMGRAGRSYVVNNFNRDNLARTMLDTIQETATVSQECRTC